MHRFSMSGLMTLMSLILVMPTGLAADTAAGETEAAPAQPPPRPAFAYRPPNRGAPVRRVGGGTRSIDQLSALAPNHTGITTRTRPRLYWFISPGFRNKVRFRLGETGVNPPLLEILLPPQPNGGIQYLDLATHDVRLEPGKLYEWAVRLEPFPHQRVPPLVSGGRIAVDDSYAPLQSAPADQRPFLAAQRGYWYDAVDWISQLIESDSTNGLLRLQRAELLEQGDLVSASLYEREMLKTAH